MKTTIKIIFIALLLMLIMSVSSYAAVEDSTDETIAEYTNTYDLTEGQLEFVESAPIVINEGSSIPQVIVNTDAQDYLSFGAFIFSRGFTGLVTSTFSCEKSLTGQGLENTQVGVLVYQKNALGEKEVLFESNKVLGASGLYSSVVKFKPDSVQYVVIAVAYDGTTEFRVFEVTTKTLETKLLLESIEINFSSIEPGPSSTETVESIYNWLNIPNIDF